jgi:septal ring factor EnvC (AmiA/AmiB activator)
MAKKKPEDAMVEVRLNQKERAKSAQQLAATHKELEALEADWSAQRKEHREAKTGLNQRADRLSDEVLDGVRLEPAQTTIEDA